MNEDLSEVKAFLRRAITLRRRLDEHNDYLRYLRAMAAGVRSQNFSEIPVNGGSERQRLADAVAVIVDYENKVIRDAEALVSYLNDVDLVLSHVMDDTLRSLLRRRYQQCETWERIAVEMNYSWRHVLRMHARALTEAKRAYEAVKENLTAVSLR